MPHIEDRLLAVEHATAVALCLATFGLAGKDGEREQATRQVKTMLALLTRVNVDTINNAGFDEALTTLIARYQNLMAEP